jgi:hypothetical protein
MGNSMSSCPKFVSRSICCRTVRHMFVVSRCLKKSLKHVIIISGSTSFESSRFELSQERGVAHSNSFNFLYTASQKELLGVSTLISTP